MVLCNNIYNISYIFRIKRKSTDNNYKNNNSPQGSNSKQSVKDKSMNKTNTTNNLLEVSTTISLEIQKQYIPTQQQETVKINSNKQTNKIKDKFVKIIVDMDDNKSERSYIF